jgi:hypothetical protein
MPLPMAASASREESAMLSIPVTLVCCAVPWLTRQVTNWLLAIGLVLGIALAVIGIVFSLAYYPWTDLVVLLVALTGGLLLGRVIPPRFRPLLIALLILSALDVLQIALTANSSPPGSATGQAPSGSDLLLLGNFLLLLPWGRFTLGILDLLLVTALAEHWRRRGSSYLFAVVPGVLGLFLLPTVFTLVTGVRNLGLIPFLTAGWLGSEALHRSLRRQAVPPGAGPTKAPSRAKE